jgi:hypothetical protein
MSPVVGTPYIQGFRCQCSGVRIMKMMIRELSDFALCHLSADTCLPSVACKAKGGHPTPETFIKPATSSYWPEVKSNTLADVVDDCLAELGALQLLCLFDLTGQIVGDGPGFDGVLKGVANQTGCLAPAHMVQHHGSRKD